MLLGLSAWLFCFSLGAVAANLVFEVPHTDGDDDTPSLLSKIANYTSDATIIFKKGITYNIFTPIKFPPLSNVEIKIEGNLTYPTNITAIQCE